MFVKFNFERNNIYTIAFILITLFVNKLDAQYLPDKFFIGTMQGPKLTDNLDTTNNTVTNQNINQFQLIKNCGVDYLMYPWTSGFLGIGGDGSWFDQSHNDYCLYLASKTTGLKFIVTDYRQMTGVTTFSETIGNAVITHYKNIAQTYRNSMFGYFVKDGPWPDNPTDLLETQAWLSYLNQNDDQKFPLINLVNVDAINVNDPNRKTLFEDYLDEYISNVNQDQTSKIVIGGPFLDFDYADYFYGLDIIHQKAGNKPFYRITNDITPTPANGSPDQDSSYIRFNVNTSIAYGAKGIIYWPWGSYWSRIALVDNVSGVPTPKYGWVSRMNSYIKSVIDTTIFPSKYIGTYHKSDFYKDDGSLVEIISAQNKINSSTPLLSDISDSKGMAGVFFDPTKQISYLYFVNKGYRNTMSPISPIITLKGDFTNKVFTCSNVGGIYSQVSTTLSNGNTTFQITNLYAGDGKLFKLNDNSLMFYNGGILSANAIMSGNVIITKNLTILGGVTLTIQPGTNVTFLNGSYLNVNGTLISNGTTTNKVTFDFISPNSTTQNGIRVYTGATLNVSNTTVKRAWYGIYCNYTYASPINNWEITACNTGIYFSNTPIGISNNYIHDNSMGIALYNSSPTLTLNKLSGNTNYAVSSSGSTSIPKFGNGSTQGKNKIAGNSVGVCAFSNSLPMLGNNSPLNGGYNTLGDNTLYNIYAITNGVIFAVNNYWGAPTPIKTYISNGAIASYPYLTYDPTGLSKVAPLAEDAELVLLKKAMGLIEQNDFAAARAVCLDIIDNYSDSYAAFNALSLLTQTYDFNEKETTKLKFKTLFNKGKKKLNAVAGLILAEVDKENKLKNIDEVISKYKGDAIIEDALFEKFLYYYNDIQDKDNARLVSTELDKLFPNSVSNIVAHQHLGDKDYLQKEYSFAKTNQEQKQNIVASPIPEEYNLFANYPNPFNPITVIKYALPFASNVNITVYNTLGQIVKEYLEGTKEAGYYTVNFTGENLSSGVYLYSINAVSANGKQNFNATKKMILMK